MVNWCYEWTEGREAIYSDDVLARWQLLVERSRAARVFHEPVIARAWLESRGAAVGCVPVFCWAFSDRGHEVLLPFCRAPLGWQTLWQRGLVGMGQMSFDYHDPVAVSPDDGPVAWGGYWAGLIAELRLRGIEQATLPRLHSEITSARGQCFGAGGAPFIPLAGHEDLNSFLGSRPRRHASEIRRQTRRLRERGELDLLVYSPQQRDAAISELLRFSSAHETCWAADPRGNFFRGPGVLDFYKRLLDWALPLGILHFSVLRINRSPISWVVGFLYRDVFLSYTIGYAPEAANWSPGKVHLAELISLGLKAGWKDIDLGYGAEDYKFLWTDVARPLFQLKWVASTFRSHFRQWARDASRPIRRVLTQA